MLAFDKVMLYAGDMSDAFKKACDLVGAANMARHLDVSPQAINECKKGSRPVPIPWCLTVERVTSGEVTRKDLRPDDWEKIWPDLDETPRGTASDRRTGKDRRSTRTDKPG